MKILVTGGAGFIGSHIVDRYLKLGHEVVVVDDLSSGSAANVNSAARFHLMDVRSREFSTLLELERPDVINHHAAQISVPASVQNPRLDADVNILGLLNLLEGAVRSGVKKVIFISSGGAIYGESAMYPTDESAPLEPMSPYAIAKAVSESYLRFYRHHHGLDYTTLRYSNVYGPRQVSHGEAGVVSIFMDRLLEGRPCHLYHFEGEPQGMIRDYVFVGDVVEANVAALDRGSGEAFNIATSRETTTRQLFDLVFENLRELAGIEPSLAEPVPGPARPGDIRRSCLLIEKAREGLGWTPATSIEEGIRKTVEWRLESNGK